jgi:hypothetical protein
MTGDDEPAGTERVSRADQGPDVARAGRAVEGNPEEAGTDVDAREVVGWYLRDRHQLGRVLWLLA